MTDVLPEELRSLFIIVIVAALAPLAAELGGRFLPVVVAEILLGILIGPEVLDFAETGGLVTFMSNLGLILLFFLAGLEIDFARIRGKPLKLGAWGWALSATFALSFAAVLEVRGLVIYTATALPLVGAAMVSELVYPLIALGFRRRVRGVLTPETA